ncbi:MAG: imidazole glycerol phosphate synthase subunit HisF [Acidobacteriota bacterium]
MLTLRIIPCLDIEDGRVVKGIQFQKLRDAGDPVALAEFYYQQGADEIVFLDVAATYRSQKIMAELVEKVSEKIFVPLTVGGGIKELSDIRILLRAGADKVSICSAALDNPSLIRTAAESFGSQCIVLSVDAKREGNSWFAWKKGGRERTSIDVLDWGLQGQALGAGEILLNSIDKDGTQSGYDLALTRKVAEALSIPVIASGGAGTIEQIWKAYRYGKADAVLLASLLHDKCLTISEIKKYLKKKGVPVRW